MTETEFLDLPDYDETAGMVEIYSEEDLIYLYDLDYEEIDYSELEPAEPELDESEGFIFDLNFF